MINIKCRFGFHDWSNWEYKSPNSCVQEIGCRRCSEIKNTRTNHNWRNWKYASSDSCSQARVCNRCSAKETNLTHDWGDWEYKATDPYIQEKVCKRCSKTETNDDRKELIAYKTEASELRNAMEREWVQGTYPDAEYTWYGDHQVLMRPDGSSGEGNVLTEKGEMLNAELENVESKIQEIENRIRELENK